MTCGHCQVTARLCCHLPHTDPALLACTPYCWLPLLTLAIGRVTRAGWHCGMSR